MSIANIHQENDKFWLSTLWIFRFFFIKKKKEIYAVQNQKQQTIFNIHFFFFGLDMDITKKLFFLL